MSGILSREFGYYILARDGAIIIPREAQGQFDVPSFGAGSGRGGMGHQKRYDDAVMERAMLPLKRRQMRREKALRAKKAKEAEEAKRKRRLANPEKLFADYAQWLAARRNEK